MRNRLELGEAAAGLLVRLAANHLRVALALLNDAGDQFQHPGARGIAQGAGAKLFDQHQRVGYGFVGQDADGVTALEDLAGHGRGPAAAERAMLDGHAIDGKVAIEDALRDLDAHVPGTETELETHR